MTTAEQKINALFSELVPVSGKADTVAGEIVRAVSRISYRNYNDGDHIGVGYGKETCNPAARYLLKNGGDEVAVIVRGMWGMEADSLYDKAVEMLEESAAAYIEQHPELKATPNSEDMWSYRDEREDVDDYDEEVGREAWGYIEYEKPLDPETAAGYALVADGVGCTGCVHEAASRDMDCCWNCSRNPARKPRDLYQHRPAGGERP